MADCSLTMQSSLSSFLLLHRYDLLSEFYVASKILMRLRWYRPSSNSKTSLCAEECVLAVFKKGRFCNSSLNTILLQQSMKSDFSKENDPKYVFLFSSPTTDYKSSVHNGIMNFKIRCSYCPGIMMRCCLK